MPAVQGGDPDLVAAHERFGDRVRFIGVDAQDDRGSAARFIGDYSMTYPSVFDPSNEIAISYGLYSPPATLFFDSDGTLVKTMPGQISPEDLSAELRALTRAPKGPSGSLVRLWQPCATSVERSRGSASR